MIRKMGCYQHFSPRDCHPDIAQPSTMQGVFSFALHSQTRPRQRLRGDTAKFIKHVVDREDERPYYHSNGGTFFPGS